MDHNLHYANHSFNAHRLRQFASAFFLALTFLLAGCATNQLTYSVQSIPRGVTSSGIAWPLENGVDSIHGYVVTCPGTVRSGICDPSRNQLLLRLTPGKKEDKEPSNGSYVLLHLDSNSVRWAAAGNGAPSYLNGDVAMLYYGGKHEFLDSRNGKPLGENKTLLYTFPDGVVLSLTKDNLARIDPLRGIDMWTRPGGIGEGYLNTYRTPGAVYLLSKGLYRLNPESGVGWFFETSLSHRAVAEAYAKDAAMACIGAFAGYNYYGHSQEKLTHNITSQPLEVDDKVYFAARKKLFCLEAKSGKVLWQTELPREAGSMQLYEAGPNIALIGSGWVYEDFQIVESAAPSISLFRRESGEEVGRVELTDSKILLDFRWLDSYAFALSPDQLYRLGRDLTIESSRKPTVAEGEFLRFLLPTTEELFIRCDRGVLCLGQSDLEQRWFDDLGSVRSSLKNSSKWAPALSLMTATVDVGRSYACGSMCWLTNGTGMIEGLDLSDGGKVQAKLDLSTKDLWYAGDGNFIALRDNQAFIIPVNKACKTLPEDSDKPDEMRELCAIDIYFCTPQLPLSPRYLPVLSLSPRARRWS